MVLIILSLNLGRGTVLNALFMSLVISMLQDGYLGGLKLYSMCFVSLLWRVIVEWLGRSPYCEWERRMSGLILVRISFSVTLNVVDKREWAGGGKC